MFKMGQTESYLWPVKVEIPQSGGTFETQSFDAEFKRVSQSRYKEIMAEIAAETTSDVKLCQEVVKNWKGITAEDGSEMPFSQSTFEKLLDVPRVAAAIVTAFFASRTGGKVKN